MNIVDATDDQIKVLNEELDFVEGWPDDENRVRFVFKNGTCGPWFSLLWNLTYDIVTNPRQTWQQVNL